MRSSDGISDVCSSVLASGPNIAEAVAALLRASPGLRRIVALGNCDAATALALFHGVEEMAALLLANPWVVESDSALPPPAAIRRRSWTRLRNPRKLNRKSSGSGKSVSVSVTIGGRRSH